jgi:hypothetical protein
MIKLDKAQEVDLSKARMRVPSEENISIFIDDISREVMIEKGRERIFIREADLEMVIKGLCHAQDQLDD